MAERKNEGPSIVDGELVRCSVSQVETFLLCRRAWNYDKVQNLPRKPKGKGAQIGEEGHNQIEHFAKTGEDVRGKFALAGAHLLEPYVTRLPFRGGDIRIEGSLEGPKLYTAGGIQIIGYFDLMVPDQVEPEIIDHKFSKKIAFAPVGYGKTPEQLRVDVQGTTYAKWVTLANPSARRVRFTHHRHQTEGRIHAERVSTVLELTHVEEQWHKVEQLIDGPIRQTAREKNPLAVEPNESSCKAFGGCSFEKVCPNSPRNKYAARFRREETSNMGLLNNLKNQNQGAPLAAPPPAASQPPASASTASAPVTANTSAGGVLAASCKLNVWYTLPSGQKGAFQVAAPNGKAYFLGEGNASLSCGTNEIVTEVGQTASAPTGTQVPAISCEAGRVYLVAGRRHRWIGVVGGMVSFANLEHAGATMNLAPTETVTDTGERDAGTTSVTPPDMPASNPGTSAPQTASAPAASSTTTEKTSGRGRKKADTSAAGIVLLVGVRANFETEDLGSFVGDLVRNLQTECKVDEIRLAPKDSILAYNGWKGALATLATEKTLAPGFYSIEPGDLADPVIEALSMMPNVRVIRA